MNVRVSIIIPVYNVEAYIIECLESVARQTYQGEMECLIVDDCGIDNSIAKSENYISRYDGDIEFRILHHDHNRGLSAARNTGMEAATGDYIYFLDSDDTILPETIDEMANVVDKYPLVEMVQAGMACMNGQVVEDFIQRDLPTYIDDAKWIVENMFINLPVSSCNRLLKRMFLIENNVAFHEGIIHEDVPYCFLLSLRCHKIGFVKKNTYLVRTHREGSITNTPQEKYALQSRFTAINDCIDAYLSNRVETRALQIVVVKVLWKKWMYYMMIHSCKALFCFSADISTISRRMLSITPYPSKVVAKLYSLLPLRIRGNKRIIRAFSFFMTD